MTTDPATTTNNTTTKEHDEWPQFRTWTRRSVGSLICCAMSFGRLTSENHRRHWRGVPISFVRDALDLAFPAPHRVGWTGSCAVGNVNAPSEQWSEVLAGVLNNPKPSFEEAVVATGLNNPTKIVAKCREIVTAVPQSERHDRDASCAIALYTLDLGMGESCNPNYLLNKAISDGDPNLRSKWSGVISLLVAALSEMQPSSVLAMYISGRCAITDADKQLYWTTFSSATPDATFLKANSFENDPDDSILALSGAAYDITAFSGKKEFLLVPGKKYSVIGRNTSRNDITPILNLMEVGQADSQWTKYTTPPAPFRRLRKDIINSMEPEWLLCEPAVPKWDSKNQNEVDVEFRPPVHPYSLGFYVVNFKLPPEYPFRPPAVQFKTPILHPNLNNENQLCSCDCMFPILGDQWSPQCGILSVMNSISSWMETDKSWTEHGCGGSAQLRQEYIDNKAEFMRRAEEHVKTHASRPHLPLSSLYLNF
ncbi:hypothetical protein Pelo_4194 [Pelomyxa schiedti]|nr:hypothetical protein Pelo_4194 [Pelomyxa schiedti]